LTVKIISGKVVGFSWHSDCCGRGWKEKIRRKQLANWVVLGGRSGTQINGGTVVSHLHLCTLDFHNAEKEESAQ